MTKRISMTCYSDVLCVWAYIAQARIDEVRRHFGDSVEIDYRFCSVFGDTAFKIGEGWADRGGFKGFGAHIRNIADAHRHIGVHPDIWERGRPASSTPAHLVLKAVQGIDRDRAEPLLREIRRAFFERCLDVSRWTVLAGCLDAVGVSPEAVRASTDSGLPFAALAADDRDRESLMVQGSPTLILNEGRQKLYGNVGYGVIEANINELLATPEAGAASWC